MRTLPAVLPGLLLTACAAAAPQPAPAAPDDPRLPVMDTSDDVAGKVPPALRSHGDRAITVRLVDPWTRAPLAARVRLWRLAVPAGGGWVQGDESIGDFEVPAEGGRIDGLAQGRYRLQIPGQALGAQDPPPFLLRGDVTAVRANVELPRKAHAFIRVLDEDGRAIERGEVIRTAAMSESYWAHAPEWAHPRYPETEDGPVIRGAIRGCGLDPDPHSVLAATASADRGFDVGEIATSSHAERHSEWVGVRFAGRSHVGETAPNDLGPGAEVVGVSVPFERIARCVRLPEGSLPDAKALRVTEAYGEPVDANTFRLSGGVAGFRINAWVECDGYERLTFVWSLGTENVPRALVKAAAK